MCWHRNADISKNSHFSNFFNRQTFESISNNKQSFISMEISKRKNLRVTESVSTLDILDAKMTGRNEGGGGGGGGTDPKIS